MLDREKQKLITEAELQHHLEDGWKCLGVLSDDRIVVERREPVALGFSDIIRRIVEESEIQDYLNRGWSLATIQSALVLPSGRYVVESPKA